MRSGTLSYRQPVGRVRRCLFGKGDIDRAVRITVQTGAVVDAVAVDGIVDEKIVLAIGGYGPKTFL